MKNTVLMLVRARINTQCVMATVYTKEKALGDGGLMRCKWQYSSEYSGSGEIIHNGDGKTTRWIVKGRYAPDRLKFLAENSREYLRMLLVEGRLQKYAEDFEEDLNEQIMKLFVQTRDKCEEYQKNIEIGRIDLAEKYANNCMEQARQSAVREWVYSL